MKPEQNVTDDVQEKYNHKTWHQEEEQTNTDRQYINNKPVKSKATSLPLPNKVVKCSSRNHTYIIFTPIKSHFYIVKLVYRGIHQFSYFCSKTLDCGYSLEPPRRGGSNEYSQSMFWAEMWKISEFFIWKFSFLSLLATASRLYAIAWGFLLRHKRIFITAIFIRALLLNQTQCGTITANWMWSRGFFL